MSDTVELVSELVREKDQCRLALEKAHSEILNRDTIIVSLAMKLLGENGKKTIVLDNLDAVKTKVYEFQASDDNSSGELILMDEKKEDESQQKT